MKEEYLSWQCWGPVGDMLYNTPYVACFGKTYQITRHPGTDVVQVRVGRASARKQYTLSASMLCLHDSCEPHTPKASVLCLHHSRKTHASNASKVRKKSYESITSDNVCTYTPSSNPMLLSKSRLITSCSAMHVLYMILRAFAGV